MDQLTFEGPWEEIARRGAELAGRRVRLTVLDEPAGPATLDRVLAPFIAEAERLGDLLPPLQPLPTTDEWVDVVVEKYRNQGFKL